MLSDESRAKRSVHEFQRLPLDERLVVFHAEVREDWVDLGRLVHRLTVAQNRPVAYLTSDLDDPLLQRPQPNLHAYYVGRGRTRKRLFRQLRANVVVVSRPSIGRDLPRSKECDIHYALILGGLQSVSTTHSEATLRGYGTIFCSGPHQTEELRDCLGDDVHVLELGNARVDAILERRRRYPDEVDSFHTPSVLVAPDTAEFFRRGGTDIVERLLLAGFRVTVHLAPGFPNGDKTARQLEKQLGIIPGLLVHRAPATPSLLFSSQLVVTDWSDLALQYALGMERPVVFIDVPRTDRRAAGTVRRRPIEVALRDRLGRIVDTEKLPDIARICDRVMRGGTPDAESLERLRSQVVYHASLSGAIGSAAIEALTLQHDPEAALQRALNELTKRDEPKRWDAA
ncbi:MAG: hypothetical protein KDC38_18840 [Planctomycetes bacterium]|nr:hypothetical protein [Planctomycetota bacterium]